jgi:hypothetical protein
MILLKNPSSIQNIHINKVTPLTFKSKTKEKPKANKFCWDKHKKGIITYITKLIPLLTHPHNNHQTQPCIIEPEQYLIQNNLYDIVVLERK